MNAELTHDILARKIGQKVSVEDKQIRKMERFIRENYELFLERGKKAFLSVEDLEYIKPVLDKLSLPQEEKDFLEKSGSFQKRKQLLKNLGLAVLTIVLIALIGIGVKNFLDYQSALKLTEKERGEIEVLEAEVKETNQFIEEKETEKETKQKEITDKEEELKSGEEEKKKAEAEIKIVQEELKKGEVEKKKAELEIAKLNEEQIKLNEDLKASIERAKLLPAKMKEAEDVMKSGDIAKQKEFFKKMAQDESRWSEYLGVMNWEEAKKACVKKGEGWRLPTRLEYQGAYENKVLVEKWEKDATWYWTGDVFSDDIAYIFFISNGNSVHVHKDYGYSYVRCIR